jgi:hypothetical protein
MTKRTTTAIRFNPELHAELVAAAEARQMSLNALVNALCDHGLDLLAPPAGLFKDAATEEPSGD